MSQWHIYIYWHSYVFVGTVDDTGSAGHHP